MSTAVARDLEPLCELVRSEFGELPGLRLILSQAQTLWSLDESTCRRVLQKLVDADFLVRIDGEFCRADQIDGAASID
jgi:hypothetical protein